MREAAILNNQKIAIFWQWFERSAQNLAQLRILALRTGPAFKISDFYKTKMTD